MESLLQHGRELIQKEPLKSSQLEFYAAELLPKLSEADILAAIKHHSLDNHWPSVNEILAFNQKATSSDKAEAEKLVSRAIALLRYPQNGGDSKASESDPEAYSLLMKAGRWYDLHVRSESPRAMTDLRFELKTLAEDALKTAKNGQQTALNSSGNQPQLEASKKQLQPSSEPFVPDPDIARKIEEMTKANLAKLKNM